MAALRAAGVASFGVNLFVPGRPGGRPGACRRLRGFPRRRGGRARRGARVEPRGTTTTTRRRSRCCWRAARRWSASPSASPSPTSSGHCGRRGRWWCCRPRPPRRPPLAVAMGPDALCLQGCEAGAHRASLANDDRPDQDRPLRALLATVPPPHARAAGRRGRGERPGERVDLLARGACPGPGRHRVPPLSREWRPAGPQGRARSPRGPTRPPSPAPSAGAGPGPSSTPWCASTGTRRRPTPRSTTPPARSGPPRPRCRRPRRMSLYAGTGSAGPRPGPPARWWSTWCQDCAREQPARDEDHGVHAARGGRPSPTRWRTCGPRGAAGSTCMPGIDEEAADVEQPAGLFAFFGNRTPPVTMATVMPAQAAIVASPRG